MEAGLIVKHKDAFPHSYSFVLCKCKIFKAAIVQIEVLWVVTPAFRWNVLPDIQGCSVCLIIIIIISFLLVNISLKHRWFTLEVSLAKPLFNFTRRLVFFFCELLGTT